MGYLAGEVASMVGNAAGNVPLNIVAFSRGTGAAVDLTNTLTQQFGVSGDRIHDYLIDPFVGKNNNRILDGHVDATHVYHSTLSGMASILGPLAGYGRDVVQGSATLFGPSYSEFHGQMDSYSTGVLSFIEDHILGRW
jgi:hypothetical protein